MNAAIPLWQRARALRSSELHNVPWLASLERRRAGACHCIDGCRHRGGWRPAGPHRPGAHHWFGVIEGLLKMSNDNSQAAPLTFTGLPPGA